MATANPNRTYITDAMWWLWLACHGFIPGVRLGGIYADKKGYHNTVFANLSKWPGNYSVRHAIDRRDPKDKARAIDLTMNDTWMRTITRRLLDGAARRDPRMRCVKEFYGTLDGRTVVGRIKDSEDGAYRSASSDTSHTWHVHIGILTPYAGDRKALEGLASLLSGESLEDWFKRAWGTDAGKLPVAGLPAPTLREGAEGPAVLALQVYLNGVINAGLVEDGDFGPATTAAVRELQRRARITTNGIYDRDTAAALRHLLEDDMSTWDEEIPLITGQGVAYSGTKWPAKFLAASNHYYTLLYGQKIAAEQAKQTALMKSIAAGQSGLTEDAITAAVAEGVRQAIPSPEELATAVAAAVDHDLDTAAVAAALREVLGSVDNEARE